MHIVKKTQGVDGKTYKVCNGTWYYEETDDKVIEVLENARLSGTRIRIYLGDKETGRDWGEVCDVTGYVGRSTGPIKIPILLHNARSMSGGGILTDCLVKIEHANKRKGGILYLHPLYHLE